MTLDECKKNIGQYVSYKPFENCMFGMEQLGIIKSVNDNYVFVIWVNYKYSEESNKGIPINPEQLQLTYVAKRLDKNQGGIFSIG